MDPKANLYWLDRQARRPTVARSFPPAWRVVIAFFVAPIIASLVGAGLIFLGAQGWKSFQGAIFLCVYAYPQTLLFGVPAYRIARNRLRPTLLNCGLVGAAVGSGPWFFLFGWMGIAGRAPIEVWLELLIGLIAPTAASGALAGAVFWGIATVGWRPDAEIVGPAAHRAE